MPCENHKHVSIPRWALGIFSAWEGEWEGVRVEGNARDEVDRNPQVTVPPGPPNTVQVGLAVLGEVKVDHHIDGLDVDPAGEKVCERAHKGNDEIPTQKPASRDNEPV